MSAFFKFQVMLGDSKVLGRFLRLKGFSKQALVNVRHHGGLLLVNHKRRLMNYHLQIGDQVILVLGNEGSQSTLRLSPRPLVIVTQTPDYLVINKPADLLTIPSRFKTDDSLVNRLLFYFKAQCHYQEQKTMARPHVVTRLDRQTSGLVLVGKTGATQAWFSALSKRKFIKRYHAIVHGNFAPSECQGHITLPIAQDQHRIKRVIRSDGQRAETVYRVLAQTKGASLLEIRLLTGRTHQIRVHFNAIGHPLYGDPLYGIPDGFHRQALNAFSLTFVTPFAAEKVMTTIPDPIDFCQLWRTLSRR